MHQPPPTLRDVAEAAGVHTSTVSRALNPATSDVVNPDTAERVKDAAERLGYEPHPLARGLRTKRTMTVGMVIPDVENPLFGPIIAGVEREIGQAGYSLLIANTRPEAEEEQDVVDTLLARRVDGLLIATAQIDDLVTQQLAERNVVAVMLNRHDNAATFPAIVGDDNNGIGEAIDHLHQLGHRMLAHIAGPQHLSTGAARAEAFARHAARHNLTTATEEAEWFGIDPGAKASQRLLQDHPELTAIVAANDLIALGCYRTARQHGLNVGTDISITGYNDIPLGDLMQPALTSVHVPYRQMGARAARMLLDWIDTAEAPATEPTFLEPRLMIRGSTGPAHS